MSYKNPLETVGNTPWVALDWSCTLNVVLRVKLEFSNPTGSVKDRAASHVISRILASGEIDRNSVVIESSSGNFGISLASYCRYYGVAFHCVIDENICAENEAIIRALSAKVFKAVEPDATGGYLLTRIKIIEDLIAKFPRYYWVNQYANPYNVEAYYQTLGRELCDESQRIDYVFLGVGSGGTIAGVAKRVKACFPRAKVIAVDVEGSIIFGGLPKKRFIPGIGSGMIPAILAGAKIDNVVIVTERETVQMCHRFFDEHGFLIGGSSGSVLAGVTKYFSQCKPPELIQVVAIFADRGDRYLSTIYNKQWCLERGL